MLEKNREAWLTEVAKMCEPLFDGYRLPKYRVTCGWPASGGLSPKKRVIGQCHSGKSSTDGTHELFISPVLGKPIEVAATIVHEMVHVAVGVEARHGKQFKVLAVHVGLAGKMTETVPSKPLTDKLAKITDKVGIYPHAAMVPALKISKPPSSTKVTCEKCGCSVTISFKWMASSGTPTCGCGGPMKMEDEDA